MNMMRRGTGRKDDGITRGDLLKRAAAAGGLLLSGSVGQAAPPCGVARARPRQAPRARSRA